MPRSNYCCYVILKLVLFAEKIVLITGLFQNISETPNLVKMKVTIFGLYIKIALCIYTVVYLLC